MKKAVIQTGGKQYLVTEGEEIMVELIKNVDKTASFETLLFIEDDKVTVGAPFIEKIKVTADIIESDQMADKVTSIRFKAKKRVHKVRGHRQHLTKLKINKIA
jgi:large subunit ribosomal protein L21